MSLFKLFHVSDLHFGDSLPQRLAPVQWGWGSHEPHVVSRLAELIRKLASEYEAARVPNRVVCSGDLTTWGTQNAIRLAYNFLSNRTIVPASNSGGRPRHTVALPDATASYLPGNHDVWAGIPILAPGPLQPREELSCYQYLYTRTAPLADLINGQPFPYRRLLFENDDIVLRLYGLDSTRVDLAPREELASRDLAILMAAYDEAPQWLKSRLTTRHLLNLRRSLLAPLSDEDLQSAIAAMAVGYIDEGQITRLTRFINQEQEEFRGSRRRLVRLAMVHHPIAFRETPPDDPDWNPDPLRRLLGLEGIQAALQSCGFFGVLCGHQHKGFVQKISPDSTKPPLHVFSVGTACQKQPELSLHELALLQRNPHFRRNETPVSTEEAAETTAAFEKLNEFAIYGLDQHESQYVWEVSRARFIPEDDKFIIQSEADRYPLS